MNFLIRLQDEPVEYLYKRVFVEYNSDSRSYKLLLAYQIYSWFITRNDNLRKKMKKLLCYINYINVLHDVI